MLYYYVDYFLLPIICIRLCPMYDFNHFKRWIYLLIILNILCLFNYNSYNWSDCYNIYFKLVQKC